MPARDRVYVDIITDTKKSQNSLAKYSLAIGAAVAAVAGIVKAINEFTNAASEAEEISNKFAVTFNDVALQAEKAAQEIADGYGLALSSSKKLLSGTGDLLTGLGFTDQAALELSESVTKLAVDLASFTNYQGGASGAADALTKGLLGEREMMKSLGISILEADLNQRLLAEGKANLTGMALKQARAEATLQLALEQSKNAIGDYARTSDSYANVSRRLKEETTELKEELGEALLPVMGKLKQGMIEIVNGVTDWIAKQNDLRTALSKVAKGDELTISDEFVLAQKNVEDLQSQLYALQQQLNDVSMGGIGVDAAQMEAGKAQLQEMISMVEYNLSIEKQRLQYLVMEEKLLGDLTEEEEKRAAADAAAAQAKLERQQAYKDWLTELWSATDEAQRAALETDLARLEANLEVAKIHDWDYQLLVDSIAMLKEKLGLEEESVGIWENLTEEMMYMYNAGLVPVYGTLVSLVEEIEEGETAVDKFNKSVDELMKSLGDQALTTALSTFQDLGKELAEGTASMDTLAQAFIDYVATAMLEASSLMLVKGLALLPSPIGFALIAASGLLALGSGMLESVDVSGDETTTTTTNNTVIVQGSVVAEEEIVNTVEHGIGTEMRGW
jgi:hypothetical protein